MSCTMYMCKIKLLQLKDTMQRFLQHAAYLILDIAPTFELISILQ